MGGEAFPFATLRCLKVKLSSLTVSDLSSICQKHPISATILRFWDSPESQRIDLYKYTAKTHEKPNESTESRPETNEHLSEVGIHVSHLVSTQGTTIHRSTSQLPKSLFSSGDHFQHSQQSQGICKRFHESSEQKTPRTTILDDQESTRSPWGH